MTALPCATSAAAAVPEQRTFCSSYTAVKGADSSIARRSKLISELPKKICKFVDNHSISLQMPSPTEGLLSMCHTPMCYTLKVILWWSSLPKHLSKEAAQSLGTRVIGHESRVPVLEEFITYDGEESPALSYLWHKEARSLVYQASSTNVKWWEMGDIYYQGDMSATIQICSGRADLVYLLLSNK